MATVQAGAGQQIRYRDGDDKQFTLEYAGLRQLTDGRTLIDKIKITLEDGATMTAEQAETRGSLASEDLPAELVLTKTVRLRTPEGATVETEAATYQSASGRATMPDAVAFTRGRVSGRGIGGSYERETGVFTIVSEASIALAPVDGKEPVNATSASLTFNRSSKALLLEKDARITTAGSTMTADRATLYLSDAEDQFRVIELRGQSRVMPIPGAATANGTPDMRAADIDLAFHEGSQALQRAVLTRDAQMIVTEASGTQSVSAATIVAETAADGRTLTLLGDRERVNVRTPARDATPERVVTATH
jgi:hypothetical protein